MEVGRGRHPVHDRRRLDAAGGEDVVLDGVLLVEHHRRHPRPVVAPPAPPPLRERRRRGGAVAQRAQRLDHAALDGDRIGRHRTQHVTAAQQVGRVRLVLDVQPQRHPLPLADRAEHPAEPGVQRVGVHRDRELDRSACRSVEGVRRLVVQQAGLPGQAEQPLARGSRGARARATHEHLAGHRLEPADPLADRARGHVQLAGGGLEGAPLDDRHQGGQLVGVRPHVKRC